MEKKKLLAEQGRSGFKVLLIKMHWVYMGIEKIYFKAKRFTGNIKMADSMIRYFCWFIGFKES